MLKEVKAFRGVSPNGPKARRPLGGQNPLDRAIGYFFPIRAAKRMRSRLAMAAANAYDGTSKIPRALKEWSTFGDNAATDTHILNKGEQMVHNYGFYSNKSRGLRKKASTDDDMPALIDSEISRKAFRKNWARLIQKI